MFLKNTWYVACTPEELANAPLGRTICGEQMVFYRDANDQVVALEDFCPHRGAPLSLGYVKNGLLICGYHGLGMCCKGITRSMPGQRVNGFPVIKHFAAEERDGFIWVWPGEPDMADTALIPSLAWANSKEWAYGGGMYHINCDYRLMIDNLMDLTHETYVHASSIGQKEIDEVAPATKMQGEEVITERHMSSVTAPPFWRQALTCNGLDADVKVDRWQICRFIPPSHVLIEVGVAYAGLGAYHAPDNVKVSATVVDFITPETETSMWYFWGMARNFKPDDDGLTGVIKAGQGAIFKEDLVMLERQQTNLLLNADRRLLKLNIDAGGVKSRHLLDQLISAKLSRR